MRARMSRWLRVALIGLGVWLLASPEPMLAQAPRGENLTAEQKAKLEERDGQVKKANQLRSRGDYREALAPAARALTLTREMRGAEHAEVAEALTRLAEFQLLAGDLEAAVRSGQAALVLRTNLDGEKHWRTADARLALEFARKAAGLEEAKRDRLVGAVRNEHKAAGLVLQGAYEDADRAAGGAVRACFDLVGEDARLGRGIVSRAVYKAVNGARHLECWVHRP